MKKISYLILVFVFIFSGCSKKLDLNQTIIKNFEERYTIEDENKLLHACQQNGEYNLSIRFDRDIFRIEINAVSQKGKFYYYKLHESEKIFVYDIEIQTTEIKIMTDEEYVIPHKVLFIYNDVTSNISEYTFSERISTIKYDVDLLRANYPMQKYFDILNNYLIIPFGNEELQKNFIEKELNEEISYKTNYTGAGSGNLIFSTLLLKGENNEGVSYEIFEDCRTY